MEVKMNTTDRKGLVKAIAEITGTTAAYKGAPTFAYEIGEYTIDRNSTLTFTDKTNADHLLQVLEERGYPHEEASTQLTVELPRERFTDDIIANLDRIIESNGNLIKKAVGTDSLAYECHDDRVLFPWFTLTGNESEAMACAQFISALVDMATTQKRIIAKPKEVENEKYAVRCFLLRLGFIGDEYKSARKVLLRNLSGNSAWKAGHQTALTKE